MECTAQLDGAIKCTAQLDGAIAYAQLAGATAWPDSSFESLSSNAATRISSVWEPLGSTESIIFSFFILVDTRGTLVK